MIRRAKAEDLDQLVALANRVRDEINGRRKIPYPEIEPERIRQTILLSEHQPALFATFVAEAGRIVGFVTGVMCVWTFSSRLMAIESDIYVIPESRGSPAAYRLIRAFEDWARASGAEYIETTSDAARDIGGFYKRMGYDHAGKRYWKWVAQTLSAS